MKCIPLNTDTLFSISYTKEHFVFISETPDHQNEFLLTPSIYHRIFVGINCHFKISETTIYITEMNDSHKEQTLYIIPKLEQWYTIKIIGNPQWLQLSTKILLIRNFLQNKYSLNHQFDALSISLNKIPINTLLFTSTIEEYLKKMVVRDTETSLDKLLFFLHKGEPINKIADLLHISYRTLHRKFTNKTGISPSSYMKIFKFFNLLENQFSSTTPYIDHTYYDASHLTKTYKQMTGYTPTQFYINLKPITSSFYKKQ